MKPRVLLVATTYPRWADDQVPKFIQEFARSLADSCTVHVLAPHAKGALRFEDSDGIQVHRFVYAPVALEKFGAGLSIIEILKRHAWYALLIPPFVLAATFEIVALQRQERFDVIHVHWLIPFGPVVGLLRRLTKFRYIITAHGTDVFPFAEGQGLTHHLLGWIHRIFTVPAADRIVAVSRALEAALLHWIPAIPPDKLCLGPMGFDSSLFSPAVATGTRRAGPRLVFVGRLVEVKGVRYLIDAVDILRNRGVAVELRICGDGPLRRLLEEQVARLALSNSVRFEGHVAHDALPAVFYRADVFVGPSVSTSLGEAEGFGLTFLEAQAAGLPVIGTDVGGIPDVIVDGQSGLLVTEKDAGAIAQSVLQLMGDDALRERIIRNGLAQARAHDWSSVARRYLQLYGVSRDRA